MITGLEPLLIAKLAAAIKGGVLISAHHGAAAALAKSFVAAAHSAGLVPAIQGLIQTLGGVAGVAGVISALSALSDALEGGKSRDAVLKLMDAVQGAAGFAN